MDIANIRGGKPNSISERENGTVTEEETPDKKGLKKDGEVVLTPDDPNFVKPLHPDEIAFQAGEQAKKDEAERIKKEEDAKNTPPVTPVPTVDYKEKFSQSSREALILVGKLKETEALLGKLTSENIPTEAELAQTVPNYEYMTENEKYLVKRQIAVENDSRRITLNNERTRLNTEYAKQIDIMVVSDPRLKGKESEFRDFISKPSRQGVDGETLLSAFLFEAGNSAPVVTPPLTPRAGLARGAGGGNSDNPPLNASGYSDEQIAHMRKYDQKKYLELVRTKKI